MYVIQEEVASKLCMSTMILHIVWFSTLAPSGQGHMPGMKHTPDINIIWWGILEGGTELSNTDTGIVQCTTA